MSESKSDVLKSNSVFKPHITAMGAYQPPLEGRDPHSHELLDFNERTEPLAPPIKQALLDYIQQDRLHLYPSYGNITERLAKYCGVQPDQVAITNGSDHGIELIIRGCCREGDEAIIPQPSFAMYTQVAQVEGLSIHSPVITKENGFPTQAVLDSITEKTRLIVIANPNNPCGTIVDKETILTVAKAAPQAAILVDECYFEYSKATVAAELLDYPNLIITRTFSKTWGMPSLRFGYVLSISENIKALLNIRGPYDINQLAVVAANAALDNIPWMQSYVDEVMLHSKPVLENLFRDKGISFWASSANYLWAFPDNPEKMNQALLVENIRVRPKRDHNGLVGLRVTIGTIEQTRKMCRVIEASLE